MASYGPLKRVQACRLSALKPLKPSKLSKPLKTLKPLKRLLGMFHLQPTATPRPHINGFLWAA